MTKENLSPYSVKALRLTLENKREESKEYLKEFKEEFNIFIKKLKHLQRSSSTLLQTLKDEQKRNKKDPSRKKYFQLTVEDFNESFPDLADDIFMPVRELYDQDERWHFGEVYMFNYFKGSWMTVSSYLVHINKAISECRKTPTYFNEDGKKIYRLEPLMSQMNIIYNATCGITLAKSAFFGTAKEALNKIHLLELLFDTEERQK